MVRVKTGTDGFIDPSHLKQADIPAGQTTIEWPFLKLDNLDISTVLDEGADCSSPRRIVFHPDNDLQVTSDGQPVWPRCALCASIYHMDVDCYVTALMRTNRLDKTNDGQPKECSTCGSYLHGHADCPFQDFLGRCPVCEGSHQPEDCSRRKSMSKVSPLGGNSETHCTSQCHSQINAPVGECFHLPQVEPPPNLEWWGQSCPSCYGDCRCTFTHKPIRFCYRCGSETSDIEKHLSNCYVNKPGYALIMYQLR